MKMPIKNFTCKNLGLFVFAVCMVAATELGVAAQARDPFRKPVVAAPRPKKNATKGAVKLATPTVIAAAPIQARIDNYKAMRQRAAELGIAAPKPTIVLTLDEMQVTGIFRTPRGYAAMVEATPLTPKLSYTIYPGEKFYDGQLVAIEDSKLIFRRVTRMTNGKEIIAVENKILRQGGISDMAVPRSENPAPTVTTPVGGLPAEAVPMAEPQEAKTKKHK
jgi:hypothetical protein